MTDGFTGVTGGVRLLNALSSLDRDTTEGQHPVGTTAVLLGTDERLDRAWRNRARLGAALVRDGFSTVVSPGYSTWRTDSPFASRVAMLQSAYVAVELGRHLPTIPTIVWRYWRDLNLWADWIDGNHVQTIAVDAGSLRNHSEWLACLVGINYLAVALFMHGRTLPHLLLSGPSTRERIAGAARTWEGPLTIVSQRPWLLAMRRIVWGPELVQEPAARWETPRDLLRENIASFQRVVHSVYEEAGRTPTQVFA